MGLDAGDLDGDGRLDLVVTNFQLETNTVLRGLGAGRFDNVTDTSGVGEATLLRLAFGVTLADFDLDGDQDLLFANGHVDDQVQAFDPRATFQQLPQVLENRSAPGRIRFADVTPEVLTAAPAVGRGSVLLDVDGDGDLDVAINNLGGAAQLLENRSGRVGRHFLVVRLVGPAGNRGAVGTLVAAEAGGRRLLRRVRAGSSFASCSTRDAHFGLGLAQAARVTLTWPDGTVQDLGLLDSDRLHVARHPSLLTPPARPPAERP